MEHEIIVVDNASSDDSVAYIQKHCSDIKLIINESNMGFASGNNLGATYASGKYILLLNNDTMLLADINDALMLLDKNDEIGVLGSKMLGSNREYRFSAGFFPSPFRLIKISTLYKKDGFFRDGNFPQDRKSYFSVDWVEGSFLLTRRLLWERLEGLDEGYFMYLEDVDYCRRIQKHGLRTVYFPTMSYIHFGGYNYARIVMLIKGFRRYHDKFSGLVTRFLANMILSISLIGQIFCNGSLALTGKKIRKKRVYACWEALRKSPW